ncbi:hypothetical protein NUW58_g8982 [Xylaria curta]|uniref:Uncharacterized protein n=1 Tax=Xylaria curta TaxID=42375 RepID=A0ACC1N396_9PEZI|nr:hypothetical protein NUW58_g8982 [Xylaria curta]
MASSSLPGPPQAPPPASAKVKVKTTWPTIPPNTDRKPIRTERLLLRPITATDVEAIYQLRTQPEVMLWTLLGTVDKDVDESRAFIERFLSPKDLKTFNFAVVYLGDDDKSENADGVLIGTAGVHKILPESGWAEAGYMFRKEYWNKGLATEAMRALTKAWWALARTEIELEVDAASVEKRGEKSEGGVMQVPEILTALIETSNIGSQRVLEKAGFKEYKTWTEPDSRAGFEGRTATLVLFLLEAPDS